MDGLEARDAEIDIMPLQYASPESEEDMDADEDKDKDEDVKNADKEVEYERPTSPSRVPQMVPRQVGTTGALFCSVRP